MQGDMMDFNNSDGEDFDTNNKIERFDYYNDFDDDFDEEDLS